MVPVLVLLVLVAENKSQQKRIEKTISPMTRKHIPAAATSYIYVHAILVSKSFFIVDATPRSVVVLPKLCRNF